MGKWATYRKRGRGADAPGTIGVPVYGVDWAATAASTEAEWLIDAPAPPTGTQLEIQLSDSPEGIALGFAIVTPIALSGEGTSFSGIVYTRARRVDMTPTPLTDWSEITELDPP